MRPIRDRSSTITWQECCPTSKPKSSGAPIRPKDSSYCPGAGSLNAPSPGSTAVEDLPRTGRTSIARASHSCALPQSASCCENSVIPLDVLGQTLSEICQAASLAPPQGGSDVGQNRFDHMRVVGNAQLVGDGQQ